MGFNFGGMIPWEGTADRFTGAFGGNSNYDRQEKVDARKNVRHTYDTNFQGVVGKVEAAKAMGLHPLAALGAPIAGGFGPSNMNGSASFSNDPPPEVNPEKDPNIDRYNKARADKAELEVKQLQAALDKLAAQPGNGGVRGMWETAPGQWETGVTGQTRGGAGPAIEYKPVELLPQTAPGSGVTPGVHPGTETWRDGSSGNIYQRPAGAQAESAEVTNTVRDLAAHYGVDFGTALNLALAGLAAWPGARLVRGAYMSYAAKREAADLAKKAALAEAAKKRVHRGTVR